MPLARPPKKTGSIELRVADELKVAFAEQCRADGVTVSEAVRRLMEERLTSAPAGQVSRSARARLVAAGLVGAALGIGVAAPSFAHAASARPSFQQLDRNGDGVLTPAEFR